MVCHRNISVDTLHKGDTDDDDDNGGDDDDDDDDNNNNNNNNCNNCIFYSYFKNCLQNNILLLNLKFSC